MVCMDYIQRRVITFNLLHNILGSTLEHDVCKIESNFFYYAILWANFKHVVNVNVLILSCYL